MFKKIHWKTNWPTHLRAEDSSAATFIGMGVNIGTHGERVRLLMLALHKINSLPGTRVLAASSLYETPPWGFLDQAVFYNAAVAVRTSLRPLPLLHALKSIEVQLGRKSRKRWGPREIDLDILLNGRRRLRSIDLQVPHKYLTERQFILVPLLEISYLTALPSGQELRHFLKR